MKKRSMSVPEGRGGRTTKGKGEKELRVSRARAGWGGDTGDGWFDERRVYKITH